MKNSFNRRKRDHKKLGRTFPRTANKNERYE